MAASVAPWPPGFVLPARREHYQLALHRCLHFGGLQLQQNVKINLKG
jgi:hypothetical protein